MGQVNLFGQADNAGSIQLLGCLNTPPLVEEPGIQAAGHRVNQAGPANAHSFSAANDAAAELAVLQPYMVNGPGRTPHTKADIGPLQRRTRSRRTGDHPFSAAQNHFSVGANIHQQRPRLCLIQFCRNNTGHGVRAYIAGYIRDSQKRSISPERQKRIGSLNLRAGQNRRKGDLRKIFRGNPQEKLLHTGISYNADSSDIPWQPSGLAA